MMIAGTPASSTFAREENLVEQCAGLLLVALLSQRELGDEDLARLGEHALLPCGKTAVLITTPQVADDLADLDHVAGGELLKVRLVTTRPVRRLFRERRAEHLEHVIETLLADHIAHADQVDVLCRHLDDQVALRDIELQIFLRLALDDAILDLDDRRGPVVRIDDRLANLKKHKSCPFGNLQNTTGDMR